MWLALSSENTLSDGEFPAIARLVDEEGGEQNRSVGELQLFAGQSITLGPLVNNQDDLPRCDMMVMISVLSKFYFVIQLGQLLEQL